MIPAGRPLRVGVLGCADIARRRVLPALAALEETELTAVASRSIERARALAGAFGAAPVSGYAALLAREDVDAVYVPVPAALHATWVSAALDAGKHVLAEKPLTIRGGQTAELIGRARDRGLVLMENVMFVHHTQHEAVRRLVERGAIGRLRALRAVFAVPERPAGDIRYDPALGGGALWDVGVYPLRAALHLLGPELSVAGAVLSRGRGRNVDTSGSVLLRRADGVTAQLLFGMEHAYGSEYELWGSEGRLWLDRAFTPAADHEPVVRIQRGSVVEEVVLPAEDQVATTLRAWVAAVREQRPADPLTLRQARLLDEVRHAAGMSTGVSHDT
ncbi:Gfo/Idh/MocA family protein [Streptomyces sp. NPDC014870]|uniref:Gfo/Idh/MocA family protein n=1 Tax=Streptomyces sp. NPDC014870 TaxID=3364925 RepID=UPI0036F5FAB2